MIVSDGLWSQLLDLRERCRTADDAAAFVCWDTHGFSMRDDATGLPGDARAVLGKRRLQLHGWRAMQILEGELWLHAPPQLDAEVLDALRLYTPLCVAPLLRADRSFVLVHMAQSIDGMVSTKSGNSKWIGNAMNLTHAHRLRALVDGVLVGGNTAHQDLPGLNVRHVDGPHPARLFFSNTFESVDRLPPVAGMRTILLRSNGAAPRDDCEIILCDSPAGQFDVAAALAALRATGIRSILIEGGPQTFATFLEAAAVDWLQAHIAPIIFGSGRPIVRLPVIDDVNDALELRNPFFTTMDDAVMVTGQL